MESAFVFVTVAASLLLGYVLSDAIYDRRREQEIAEHLKEREERLRSELREIKELRAEMEGDEKDAT